MQESEQQQPRPDVIEPTTPQEIPEQQTPSEEPQRQPDEVGPQEPDTIQPATSPSEVPSIPGN